MQRPNTEIGKNKTSLTVSVLLFIIASFIFLLWAWFSSRMGWRSQGHLNNKIFDFSDTIIATAPIILILVIAKLIKNNKKTPHRQTTVAMLLGGLVGIIAGAIVF